MPSDQAASPHLLQIQLCATPAALMLMLPSFLCTASVMLKARQLLSVAWPCFRWAGASAACWSRTSPSQDSWQWGLESAQNMEISEASRAPEILCKHTQSMLPAGDVLLGVTMQTQCCLHSTEDCSLLDKTRRGAGGSAPTGMPPLTCCCDAYSWKAQPASQWHGGRHSWVASLLLTICAAGCLHSHPHGTCCHSHFACYCPAVLLLHPAAPMPLLVANPLHCKQDPGVPGQMSLAVLVSRC